MRVDELELPDGVIEVLQEEGIVELHPPQAKAVSFALDGKNLMLAIPTASGKSLVAYLAVLKHVLEWGGKALYIVPLRALASEKFDDLKKFERLGVKVAMSAGDLDSPDPQLDDFDIIVATSEKADSLLRHQSAWLGHITLVVADEVHLIHDPGRGPTLEVTLTKFRKLNPSLQVIALSATIKNAREVADWLNAELVTSEWRPTPLKEGVFLDGRQVETPEGTNWDAAERVLMNRSVEAAVFENSCRSILSDGTVYDRCLVGVVTNVDPEMHFGEFYIDSAEKVWNVFRTQVDLVLSSGVAVLNAEDPAVVEMAPLSDGDVIFYGIDGQAEAIVAHRAEGKRAVFIKDEAIVLATGESEELLAPLSRINMLADGQAEQPGVLSNLLAAIAGAWALNISPALIRAGVLPYNPKAPLRGD